MAAATETAATIAGIAARLSQEEEENVVLRKKNSINVKPRVWATLLTAPSYLPGTLTLAASLRASGSRYPLVAMVIPELLPAEAHAALRAFGIPSVEVPKLNPQSVASAVRDKRFKDTWTKLRYVCDVLEIYKSFG